MDPTLHCNAVRCRSGEDLFAVGRVDGASSQVAGSDSAEGCAAGVGQVSTLEAPGVATGLASGEDLVDLPNLCLGEGWIDDFLLYLCRKVTFWFN